MADAIETWCPRCGPGVPSDDNGCCDMCGATCTGPGAEQALDSVKRIAELEGRIAQLERELDEWMAE